MAARFLAIVPAAGQGSRFDAVEPKQYRQLLGRPLVYHALRALCAEPRIAQVVVALAPGDVRFAKYDWSAFHGRLRAIECGGNTRAQTVRQALAALDGEASDEDWMLVHDAARPCLDAASLGRLIEALRDDAVGGLLAVPVADTLKRADADGRSQATTSREGLWQAQTPQMFRRALLVRALEHADASVTDEASAVEALGYRPKLVIGDPANLKVTFVEDLRLAQAILAARQKER